MRRKILAANWKMHKTVVETRSFFDEFKKLSPKKRDVEIIIAPSFTSLESASTCVSGTAVHLAAQNMHWEAQGAFTGEISAPMLKALRCEYVILGHSERRRLFFESDEQIQTKIRAAANQQLKIIFCVGETLQEREDGKTFSVLKIQVSAGLEGIWKEDVKNRVVVAYEPVWAIGTGRVAGAEQAEEAHQHIRKVIWDLYDMKTASQVPVIYGGSVKPDNFARIFHQPNIDGALVGAASLHAKSFIEILEQMK